MKGGKEKLILASQSPRRKELLRAVGYEFDVLPPDPSVEQGLCSGCTPEQIVSKWARLKAQYIARKLIEGTILAADTVAELDGQILGKPRDEDDAKRMLRMLSGRLHRVLTGVCLLDVKSGRFIQKVESSTLLMDQLTDNQISAYIDTDEWVGKAGGFGYQDGRDWIHLQEGLASNVVGLPVERLPDWLNELQNAVGC